MTMLDGLHPLIPFIINREINENTPVMALWDIVGGGAGGHVPARAGVTSIINPRPAAHFF